MLTRKLRASLASPNATEADSKPRATRSGPARAGGTMSIVDVLEVKYVSENPSAFDAPLRFEVTFECLDSLEDDLEWKIVYVGSAEDQGRDQVLEEVMVGPVPLGTSKFVLEAPPPSFAEIPRGDRLGVTVVSITCAYLDQPFVSVGYYVNNEYFAPGAGPREGGAAVPPEDAPPDFGAERGSKRPFSTRFG